jgi:hypothetical protein
MTPISKEELRHRLAAIASGPWAQGVMAARDKMAPLDRLPLPTSRNRSVTLDEIALSRLNLRLNKRLSTILRPHFEYETQITSPTEIATRDALDQALILPQLYELAVQTGYLPGEAVKRPARTILTDLLWSPAARTFVHAYDYVAVPMLAARVGVSGLGTAQPPEPKANAALRFAGFLAHFRAFCADEQIQTWTNFLDDYVHEPAEQYNLRRYLQGKQKTAPERTTELLTGCQLFVNSLAGAFYIMDDDELGRFGLIHAYWLQKFFGYEMDNSGYVKNVAVWGRGDSWANTVTSSQYLIPAGTDREIAKVFRQQFREQVQLLERTFGAVRALAMSARKGRNEDVLPQTSKTVSPQTSKAVLLQTSKTKEGVLKSV